MLYVFFLNAVPSRIIRIPVLWHLLYPCSNRFNHGLDREDILVVAIRNDMEFCSNFIIFIHYSYHSLEQWQSFVST
jgi:hypothetical protein